MKIYTSTDALTKIQTRYNSFESISSAQPQSVQYKGQKWKPILLLQGKLTKKAEKALRIKLIVLGIFTLGIIFCVKKYQELRKTVKTKKEKILIINKKGDPRLRNTIIKLLKIKTPPHLPQTDETPPLDSQLLNKLPGDLMKHIGEFLPAEDLIHFMQTDKDNHVMLSHILPDTLRRDRWAKAAFEIIPLIPHVFLPNDLARKKEVSDRLSKLKHEEKMQQIEFFLDLITKENINADYRFMDGMNGMSFIHHTLISYTICNCLNFRDINLSRIWYFPIAEMILKKNPDLSVKLAWGAAIKIIQTFVCYSPVDAANKKELIELILRYQPDLKDKLA